MRLLIVTQAVDKDDPVLGFFHRWIEEFATHAERVSVICLKEGRHTLPGNVDVYSLGKEKRVSRIRYVWNFYRYIWRLRSEYDAVFVHMNQEYVLLGALLWRLMGKRVVLWRNHAQGSAPTRLAAILSHAVCYTSSAAYVASYPNAIQMPIGIDTSTFKSGVSRVARSILFLGRLDPIKKPEVLVDALLELDARGEEFTAAIYGDPTVPGAPHVAALREKTVALVEKGKLSFRASVPNREAATLFASHDIYINLTPSGSFDKTIGEAMASGCVVVSANDAIRDVLPESLLVDSGSVESVVVGLEAALDMSDAERNSLRARLTSYVEREHSLSLLADRLFGILGA